RTATPGNFASKTLEMVSATCRSTEVYQITLPSLRAASTSCGVILSVDGGAARTVAVGQLSTLATAAEPTRISRRVGAGFALSFAPVLPVGYSRCLRLDAPTRTQIRDGPPVITETF